MTGQHADVEKADWDIQVSEFSHHGKYRATIINRDARPQVIVYDTASGRPLQLPAVQNGGVSSLTFSRSKKKAVVYVNGDRSPNDLYVLDFPTRQFYAADLQFAQPGDQRRRPRRCGASFDSRLATE